MVIVLVVVAVLLLMGRSNVVGLGAFGRSTPSDNFIPNRGPGDSSGVGDFGAVVGPAACVAAGSFYGGPAGAKAGVLAAPICSAVGRQAAVGAVAGIKIGVSDIKATGKDALNVIRNPLSPAAHAAAIKSATLLPAKLAYDTTKTATKATISSIKSGLGAIGISW